jgi:DNA mismatch endonuclease (patch repair protein)
MVDNLSKKTRSKVMSHIRSKWSKPEQTVHTYMKKNKVIHIMHPKMTGHPDVYVPNKNIVIFINGCFWHKCPKCYIEPKSNLNYWLTKIENNVKRDRKNKKLLKQEGYKVITVWEHDIKKNLDECLKALVHNEKANNKRKIARR